MQTTTIWIIIFYLLLLDSFSTNIISWFGFRKWYQNKGGMLARYAPLTRFWTTYYLFLVLIIGYLIHNYVVPLY